MLDDINADCGTFVNVVGRWIMLVSDGRALGRGRRAPGAARMWESERTIGDPADVGILLSRVGRFLAVILNNSEEPRMSGWQPANGGDYAPKQILLRPRDASSQSA
jgi:hypothetical protein